ncbi:MAG: sigma-54-dependent Fis family transcriptional regulator [Candidatus Saganbacteria bacterium]|nr:sigma-54-dependent Fis family transcriptional regulator [Candidatus Saganbacteria bacterium]
MGEARARILIVDDEAHLRDSLRFLLSPTYQLYFAANGTEALKLVSKVSPDLVLLDMRLPDISGLDVLKHIKETDRSIEVVMVTAVNTVSRAVEAIKLGAYDYLTKPFDIEGIQTLISKVLEKRSLQRENLYLKEEIEKKSQFEKIVGSSKLMKEVFSVISEVAKEDVTVLISGESGTGKELVARAIHNLSPRRERLFVPVNCAAIPENLIESELFGHERGSFTGAMERRIGKFEIADSGTLFLDEVGCLPLKLQGKLLRVLQEREIERLGGNKLISVDVRIIAASNRDLAKEINKGNFRQDLFYRLNVVPVALPPLRDRKEDIPLLINHFVDCFNREFGKSVRSVKPDAMRFLMEYDWPGNVRELQNLMERLVVLNRGTNITLDKLPKEVLKDDISEEEIVELDFKEATRRFEAAFIKKALDKAGGRKSRAAQMMGVHRNTLIMKERKLRNMQ